jgi:hypothetical protein
MIKIEWNWPRAYWCSGGARYDLFGCLWYLATGYYDEYRNTRIGRIRKAYPAVFNKIDRFIRNRNARETPSQYQYPPHWHDVS